MGGQVDLLPSARVTRALSRHCELQRAPGMLFLHPPASPSQEPPSLGTHICSALLVALIRPRSWVSARIMRAHFSWP